jgi:hypothetical protein
MTTPKILVLDRGELLVEQVRLAVAEMEPRPDVVLCARLSTAGEVLEAEGPFDVLVAGPSVGTRSGLTRLRLIRPRVQPASRRQPPRHREHRCPRPAAAAGRGQGAHRGAAAGHRARHGGRHPTGGGGGPRRRLGRPPAHRPRHDVHHRVGHGRVRQDLLLHEPRLLPHEVHGEAGVHRRPRPPVRRGLHRPAPATEVHDLRRPPARGRRRHRPRQPHRGVHGHPRDRRERARGPPRAGRSRSTTSSSTLPPRWPRRSSWPST